MQKVKLRDIAFSRCGEKGDISNVFVLPYNGGDYEMLLEQLTVDKVRAAYNGLVKGKIERYEFPGIKAINFVMWGALGGGVSRSLCLDLHGKSRGAIMLEIDIEVPDSYNPPRKINGEVEWTR